MVIKQMFSVFARRWFVLLVVAEHVLLASIYFSQDNVQLRIGVNNTKEKSSKNLNANQRHIQVTSHNTHTNRQEADDDLTNTVLGLLQKFADEENERKSESSAAFDGKVNDSDIARLVDEAQDQIDSASKRIKDLQKAYFVKRDRVVFDFRHDYVVKPVRNACEKGTTMIIIVHSTTEHLESRLAIRNTWGTLSTSQKWPDKNGQKQHVSLKSKLVFMLGLSRNDTYNQFVEKENELFQDIIQGDFYDDYRNMTLKSMMDLKYLTENCLHVPYLLKSDDDMFIHVPFFYDTIKNAKLRRTFAGHLHDKDLVWRKGKWALTKAEYPFKTFPWFDSGGAYIMTMDIAQELYETARFVPPIFIDDAYITGIVAKAIGNVKHVYNLNKKFSPGFEKAAPHVCKFILRQIILQHYCTPEIMLKIWEDIHKPHHCLS